MSWLRRKKLRLVGTVRCWKPRFERSWVLWSRDHHGPWKLHAGIKADLFSGRREVSMDFRLYGGADG